MTKVYLIHGWNGNSKNYWFPWLQKELEKKNFKVISFDMPNDPSAKINDWVKYLENETNNIDEKTYFVGHSVGCQTIMRYLEKLHRHKRVAGCVFVAPFFNLVGLTKEEEALAEHILNSKIDTQRVFDHTDNFLCIFSDNDPLVELTESEKFKEEFGAKIIIKKNREHFSDSKEIPEILNFIKH